MSGVWVGDSGESAGAVGGVGSAVAWGRAPGGNEGVGAGVCEHGEAAAAGDGRGADPAEGDRPLLLINLLLASALMSLCWVKQLHAVNVEFGVSWLRGYHVLAMVTVMGVMLWPMTAIALAMMVWIEARVFGFSGIGGVARDADVAWTVCAHVSYWWVLGAAIALAVMLALPTDWEQWLPNRVRVWLTGVVDWVWIAPAVVIVFVVGLLGFETLVYFGVRRCRFANAARGE